MHVAGVSTLVCQAAHHQETCQVIMMITCDRIQDREAFLSLISIEMSMLGTEQMLQQCSMVLYA